MLGNEAEGIPVLCGGWVKTPVLFLLQFVTVVYLPPRGKVWSSSVLCTVCAKLSNKENTELSESWQKLRSNFKPSVDQSPCRVEMT